VLTVDQDAPAFQVVEAKQEIDQCRFACTGPPHEPDFLARSDAQRYAVDDATMLAVVEADVLESDLAPFDDERLRVGPIDDVDGAADRLHAFLYGADRFEDRGHRGQDPAGHAD